MHSSEQVDWFFPFSAEMRQRFMNGSLAKEWRDQYSLLFDKEDLRLARSQPKNHFFEWFAAILLYQATGYLSLVEKYQFAAHPRKREVIAKLHSPELDEILAQQTRGMPQLPDLLIYSSDYRRWCFCEVKGGADRLRPEQAAHFRQLERITRRKVMILRLVPLRFSR